MNSILLYLFSFAFILFLVSFYFSFFWTQIVTVTQLCNTKKNIEDSRIDNSIQYDNNMLAL